MTCLLNTVNGRELRARGVKSYEMFSPAEIGPENAAFIVFEARLKSLREDERIMKTKLSQCMLLLAICIIGACDPGSNQCEGDCPQSDLPVNSITKQGSGCNKTIARALAMIEVDSACKAVREQAGTPCSGKCSGTNAICHLTSTTDPDLWTYTSADDRNCSHENGVRWTARYSGQVSCACICLQ
jgi:hypothetical protein